MEKPTEQLKAIRDRIEVAVSHAEANTVQAVEELGQGLIALVDLFLHDDLNEDAPADPAMAPVPPDPTLPGA